MIKLKKKEEKYFENDVGRGEERRQGNEEEGKMRRASLLFLPAVFGTSNCSVFVPLINTVLLGAPVLPTRWVKISTYLQTEQFLSDTLNLIELYKLPCFCILFVCILFYFTGAHVELVSGLPRCTKINKY
jgi:hypothetical protein